MDLRPFFFHNESDYPNETNLSVNNVETQPVQKGGQTCIEAHVVRRIGERIIFAVV